MRPIRVLILALSLLLAVPAVAAAEEEGEAGALGWSDSREPMPFDIIRSIQFLQDQVARGNDRAIRVQALLLRRFGPVFLDSAAADWADPRNRRAAVLFVLSGGPPDVLAGLLRAGVLPQEQRPMFEGALAYVRNDLERAYELLSALDLSEVEAGLAGHIQLVLGQILQERDPAGAVTHLDQARLLVPGGLIEEAALRLEIVLVDELGDHGRADRLARQYFDRYARSSYSANFEARFAAIHSARAQGDAQASIVQIDDITDGLPAERRARLYLDVGRRALVDGRLEFARLATDRALGPGVLAGDDETRGRLYELAASVGVVPAPELRGRLDAVSGAALTGADAEILRAALQAVAAIDSPIRNVAAAAATDTPDEALPVFERAERILSETSMPSPSAIR